MGEYGRKFNGNPLIEYVDVGTFGTWGEGHTSYGSGQKYGIATLLSHVNLHLKYFPNTPVMLNDDMISHLEDSGAAAKEFMEYCAGKGMGLRDDGICVKYYCDTYGYSTLRSPEFFGCFNRRAAVDIELEHYSKISPDDFKDGFPYLEALKTARATFSGFHGYVSPWIQQNRYFTEYCANRLGYWYFINGLTLAHPVSGLKSEATLHIENKGFAAAYHRYALRISARNEMGESFVLNRESPDNRTWLGRTEERLTLDFAKVPPGSYALCIGLYEGRLPVRLALRDNLILEDGSYELDRITVA